MVLDQMGCRYMPHVIAVMRGGSVEFRNSDMTMHNVHTMPADAGNADDGHLAGTKGAPQAKQFKQPEVMMPVRCDHPSVDECVYQCVGDAVFCGDGCGWAF